MKAWLIALIAVLAGMVISAVLLFQPATVADDFRLPLLSVIAVVTVLSAIAFVAAVFAEAKLTMTAHALALPEGSVRAMIALSLIVIFAVITLFVLVKFSRFDTQCKECLAALQPPAVSRLDPAAQQALVGAVTKRMEASHDLAKQLLTMLGTLLAAISAFYFGSSATASATDPNKLMNMANAVDAVRQAQPGKKDEGSAGMPPQHHL